MTGDCVNGQDGLDRNVVICLSLKDGGMFITPGEVCKSLHHRVSTSPLILV